MNTYVRTLIITGITIITGCLGETTAPQNSDDTATQESSTRSRSRISSTEISSNADYSSTNESSSSTLSYTNEPSSSLLLVIESSAEQEPSSDIQTSSATTTSSESTKTITTNESIGEWQFNGLVGGGPQQRTLTIASDLSIIYSFFTLGSERHHAEGNGEIFEETITIVWETCQSSGAPVECDASSVSGIPTQFQWNGTELFNIDDPKKLYSKQ